MNHLTEKDLISFVAAAEFNESFVELAKKISAHTRDCEDCREKLEAYQKLCDALTGYPDEYPEAYADLPRVEAEPQVQYINGQLVLSHEE